SAINLRCPCFFFSSRRRHTRCLSDWSSDVCSSDLVLAAYLKQHGYKQIDFGSERALDKLYAAARAGKPAKLFAVLNARFHEQEEIGRACVGKECRSRGATYL